MSTNPRQGALLARFQVIKDIQETWGRGILAYVGYEGFVGVGDRANHKTLHIPKPDGSTIDVGRRGERDFFSLHAKQIGVYTPEEALASGMDQLIRAGKLAYLSNCLKENKPFVFQLSRSSAAYPDRWFTVTSITSQLHTTCVSHASIGGGYRIALEEIEWSSVRLLSVEEALLSADKVTRQRVLDPHQIIVDKVAAACAIKFKETKLELSSLSKAIGAIEKGSGGTFLKNKTDKAKHKKLVDEVLNKHGWSELQTLLDRFREEWDEIGEELHKAILSGLKSEAKASV